MRHRSSFDFCKSNAIRSRRGFRILSSGPDCRCRNAGRIQRRLRVRAYVEEIYPQGFATYVTVEGLSGELEGASRPGHFRGVTTVVAILLNAVRPNFAFFGQKDAQQSIIIKQLVRDLAFDTEIVVLPIVREESGLAMSSRNAYLDIEQRQAATVLNRALMQARGLTMKASETRSIC